MMSVFNPANSLSNSLIYTDENGNRQLMLKASEKIQFNILAMTAAKKCHIRSFGRDF